MACKLYVGTVTEKFTHEVKKYVLIIISVVVMYTTAWSLDLLVNGIKERHGCMYVQ